MTVEEWLGGSNQLGIDIWNKKYRRNDEDFEHWLDRVSGGNSDVRKLIKEKKFLFGGRILSNRGVDISEEKTTYSNCYVIAPPGDSIEEIYDTCKRLARTYSYGGGVGIDISKLAPAGAVVHNQARNTSGAVSFMDTFSQVTEQIGQNGRRGALMISLSCDHPDVEKFITVKSDLNKVNYANISVRVTDDFMKAVENDDNWRLHFERPETGEKIEKIVKAKELFDLLCKQNWDYAEPGILFWDRIESYNLLNNNPDFEYAGVNPCAEEPLPSFGSCLLGSLNLSEFVSEDGDFRLNEFFEAAKIAIRGLNEVLDEGLIKHPLQEQRDCVRLWRQCGLGIMGLADALIKMGITYGSKYAVDISDAIGNYLVVAAITESNKIASEQKPYEKFDQRVFESEFFQEHERLFTGEDKTRLQYHGLRNSQLLTIAPTGTLSTMLGISGGIEPIFANYYTRMTKSLHGEDHEYKVYTPIVEKYMKEHGIEDESDLPEYFVTSGTIPVENRIAMQAIWQKHIDASISSTVNLPHEATVEDVAKIYMSAWKSGLKGITVFREGCARTSILTSSKEQKREKRASLADENTLSVIGLEHHLTTGCGSLHICAYFDKEGSLKNTYLSKGSSGGCNNFMIGLSRMISLAARNGVGIEDIVDQLNSCGTCPSYAVRRATKHDVSPGSCCPVAIGNGLMEMWKRFNGFKDVLIEHGVWDSMSSSLSDVVDKQKDKEIQPEEDIGHDVCPECGGTLKHEMGCVTCTSCGYSKCN